MTTRSSIAPRTTLAPSPAGSASSPESISSLITSIVTSKEWVLPPRPKPGRKPSVDAPASKRKAQNRAAQRAFRERRATRVQELEQKLHEVEKEKEVKEMGLINTINKLKFENQFLMKSIDLLRLDFSSLRSSLGVSNPPSAASSPTAASEPPKPGNSTSSRRLLSNTQNPNSPSTQHNLQIRPRSFLQSAPLPHPQLKISCNELEISEMGQSAQQLLNFAKSSPMASGQSPGSQHLSQYSVQQQMLPAPSVESPPGMNLRVSKTSRGSLVASTQSEKESASDIDCGVCIKDTCLCEDVGLKTSRSSNPVLEDSFESFTPIPAVSLKRKATVPLAEIDFTSEYSYRKMPDLKKLKGSAQKQIKKEPIDRMEFNEQSPLENCGFCSDDTPCVCREAAEEAARINKSLTEKSTDETTDDIYDSISGTELPPINLNSVAAIRKSSLPVLHPGPSLELREFSILSGNATPIPKEQNEPDQEKSTEKSGCTGNPGTCSQCQLDPMSTLFCTSVASKAASQKEEQSASTQLSRSGSATDTTVLQAQTPPASTASHGLGLSLPGDASHGRSMSNAGSAFGSPVLAGTNGIFIPCADAYKTLSRHKRFNTVDFSSLVGRLTTRGMLVEVQSVANVIRELDKKVYD